MYDTVTAPSMTGGAAVDGTATAAPAVTIPAISRRRRTRRSSPPAAQPLLPPRRRSVLEQPRDQRVHSVVTGFGPGRYDGLRLVQEVADHVGRHVHEVGLRLAEQLEPHPPG